MQCLGPVPTAVLASSATTPATSQEHQGAGPGPSALAGDKGTWGQTCQNSLVPLTLQSSAFLGSDLLAFMWFLLGALLGISMFLLVPSLSFPAWEQVTAEGRDVLSPPLSWEGHLD